MATSSANSLLRSLLTRERHCDQNPDGEPTDRRVAAVITCSDVRANVCDLFALQQDALYVLQTPAHVVGKLEAAGVAFAHATFGIDVAIVLGHTDCGVLRDCSWIKTDSVGVTADEVQATMSAITDKPTIDSPASLPLAHAERMAQALKQQLPEECDIPVFAAWLDEASGTVHIIDPVA